LYRRARREAINYPLTGAMSRENWCFGRRPAKCGNRVTFVAGQIASTPGGFEPVFGGVENPSMYRRLDRLLEDFLLRAVQKPSCVSRDRERFE
jgi:hypothetical protein